MERIKDKAKILPKKLTNTQQAFVDGWNLLGEAMILASEGRRHELIEDVKLQLKRSIKYEYNKLASEFAMYLYYYYYNIANDKAKATRYEAIQEKYNNLSYIEAKVQAKYAKISYELNSSRGKSKSTIQELGRICNDIRPYIRFNSAPIDIFIYKLLIVKAYTDKDLSEVIYLAHEIINNLEEKGIERTAPFYKDLTPALILQKRYVEAKEMIGQALSNQNKGTYNWSTFTFYKLIAELHYGDYQEAYRIFKIADSRRQINKAMREQWLIVRAYIKFMTNCGVMEGRTHFKFGKFLNDVPIFTADKQGNNIDIIILQILLRIGEDHGGIIDKMEAIERYSRRYLKENARARIFIKMLLKMAKCNFDKECVIANTGELFKSLKEEGKHQTNVSNLEIVLYEDLWECAIGML